MLTERGEEEMSPNDRVNTNPEEIGSGSNQAEAARMQHNPPQPIAQPVTINQIGNNGRSNLFSLLIQILIIAVTVAVTHLYLSPKQASPQPPRVEINTKKHVAPSSSSWKLVGRCIAYDSSYIIKQCQWKQTYPRPSSPENTVLSGGTRECSLPTTPSHEIDSTIDELKVPSFKGTYIFELSCGDDTGHTGDETVEILVKKLREPIITITEYKLDALVSESFTKLEASCQASQGSVKERKWIYINGPVGASPVISSEGMVRFTIPGIYVFKYQCIDSYDVLASRYTVASASVLGVWVLVGVTH